jgi:hypothetical protein
MRLAVFIVLGVVAVLALASNVGGRLTDRLTSSLFPPPPETLVVQAAELSAYPKSGASVAILRTTTFAGQQSPTAASSVIVTLQSREPLPRDQINAAAQIACRTLAQQGNAYDYVEVVNSHGLTAFGWLQVPITVSESLQQTCGQWAE